MKTKDDLRKAEYEAWQRVVDILSDRGIDVNQDSEVHVTIERWGRRYDEYQDALRNHRR